MDVNGKEYERTVETVAFKEYRLARTDVTRYCGHCMQDAYKHSVKFSLKT